MRQGQRSRWQWQKELPITQGEKDSWCGEVRHSRHPRILCLVNPPIGEGSRCQGFSARTKILDSGCSPRYNAGGKGCGRAAEKVEAPPVTRMISKTSSLISGHFEMISKTGSLISGCFRTISKSKDLISGHFQEISENRELISRHLKTISKNGGLISACFQAISFPAVLISPSRFLISKEPELISVCKIWQKLGGSGYSPTRFSISCPRNAYLAAFHRTPSLQKEGVAHGKTERRKCNQEAL